MNEYQPPKRVVIEENLGGAAGIGIGILGYWLKILA